MYGQPPRRRRRGPAGPRRGCDRPGGFRRPGAAGSPAGRSQYSIV